MHAGDLPFFTIRFCGERIHSQVTFVAMVINQRRKGAVWFDLGDKTARLVQEKMTDIS